MSEIIKKLWGEKENKREASKEVKAQPEGMTEDEYMNEEEEESVEESIYNNVVNGNWGYARKKMRDNIELIVEAMSAKDFEKVAKLLYDIQMGM